MDAIRKSFKSHNSYRHLRQISEGGGDDLMYEQEPILLSREDHRHRAMRNGGADPSSADSREVIVKIDGGGTTGDGAPAPGGGGSDGGGNIWRGSSYEFWKDEEAKIGNGNGGGFNFQNPGRDGDDPPNKLIGQFLQKQRTSGVEMALDMDLEMEELYSGDGGSCGSGGGRRLPPVAESPGSRTVKFQQPSPEEIVAEGSRRKYRDSSSSDDDGCGGDHSQELRRRERSNTCFAGSSSDEVVTCTSNSSFTRKSTLLRAKTRSRLLDQPEQLDRRSGRVPKSTQLRSGFLGKSMDNNGEEEDDLFLDEDLPDEYKKGTFNIWVLIEWVSLILIIGSLICNLTVPVFKGRTLWDLQLWKWEVMVLVLICGRLVSGWVIRVVVFLIERNFLLRKRVLYFVYGVRKAVQNCLWLGLVLLAWHYLFDKKVERETNSKVLMYVTKVLICLLVSTLVWLVKTLMVKILASSFHVSTYFDRIQESLFNQYVIETLSGPPVVEIQNAQEEEERTMAEVSRLQNAGATITPELKAAAFPPKSGKVAFSGVLQKSPIGKSTKLSGAISKKVTDDNKITIDHLHRLNHKNVSAWNMKRLINIVRHGVLSTLDEQVLDSTQYDDNTTQIRSEIEAKAAARKIFLNVAKPGRRFITLHDVSRFMPEDEAMKTFSLFEGASETRRISKSALKNWVINAFRERRALALTLNDTKTAVKKLHNMLNIVVSLILLVAWLIILGIASTKVLLLISSQLLLVAFIFGNTLKTIFEAIIFLFVMHPFDVGDRCEIDQVQMVVEEMNILTTVFLRYDNMRIIFPNSVLATKPISNYYRSPDMGDAIDFFVHIATPADKLAAIKQRITCYIENKKEHWYPSPQIVVKEVESLSSLRLAVWPNHRMNYQDIGERWERRALLVEEMVKIFKELDIQYRLYPLDINVRSLPTPTSTRVPAEWTASGN